MVLLVRLILFVAVISTCLGDYKVDYGKGTELASKRKFAEAVEAFTKVIEEKPDFPQTWQHRGSAYFRMAKLKEALADFDQFLKLRPDQAPYHWQRGIVLYYLNKFEEGAKQFEIHKTVNAEDVENSVWHFLCLARHKDVDFARKQLIPVSKDPRVPMKEVFDMFAGKIKPEEVLAACQKEDPTANELKNRLFFGHLYVGLYYEAIGKTTESKTHIDKAAGEFYVPHYMGDVAKIHQKLRSAITITK